MSLWTPGPRARAGTSGGPRRIQEDPGFDVGGVTEFSSGIHDGYPWLFRYTMGQKKQVL